MCVCVYVCVLTRAVASPRERRMFFCKADLRTEMGRPSGKGRWWVWVWVWVWVCDCVWWGSGGMLVLRRSLAVLQPGRGISFCQHQLMFGLVDACVCVCVCVSVHSQSSLPVCSSRRRMKTSRRNWREALFLRMSKAFLPAGAGEGALMLVVVVAVAAAAEGGGGATAAGAGAGEGKGVDAAAGSGGSGIGNG